MRRILLLLCGIMFIPVLCYPQHLVEVGKGYSCTSVNTTVFRNNSLITHGDEQYISYYDAEGYKYGQYAVGNVFWNVTPNCQLGVEYLYGRRMSMDKSSGHASRNQAMVQYNF